ncbi:MAG: glycerophosphodiester phosphodiesterase family protein [Proteobacteria bacterium]|nr:glycerophosphodiester phosphodiesterase family protein [Pseudomonadota bacterium]
MTNGERASEPLVIAHRGASEYRPENTLPAYQLAVEQRADMIEIDLHRTRDGAVVITHDERLEGLGGTGEIADATLEEVRALDAGAGECVPTLDEVLDGFGKRIPFNLEIKRGTRSTYEGLEQIALDALHQRGLLARTLFSSFFDPVLRELRRLSADARLAALVSPRKPERAIERALEVGAEAVNPHLVLATQEFVDEAHAAGLAVYVYTVDDEDWMVKLLDRGVDGLFTNRPDRLRAIRDG